MERQTTISKANSFTPKKFYLESTGQLPVIKENVNWFPNNRKVSLSPTHNSISTGSAVTSSDCIRKRALVCSFAHDKASIVEVKPFRRTFVGSIKEANQRKALPPHYCGYFKQKEKVNKKYKKIMDEMKKEELIEIRHAASKKESIGLAQEIEEIKQKYEDTEKLIKLQEIMELEDLLDHNKKQISYVQQPSSGIHKKEEDK